MASSSIPSSELSPVSRSSSRLGITMSGWRIACSLQTGPAIILFYISYSYRSHKTLKTMYLFPPENTPSPLVTSVTYRKVLFTLFTSSTMMFSTFPFSKSQIRGASFYPGSLFVSTLTSTRKSYIYFSSKCIPKLLTVHIRGVKIFSLVYFKI